MTKREFQFIADTRFSRTPQSDVIRMTNDLEKNIFDKAILTVYPIREVFFDDIVSYRRKFVIEKRPGYTWGDLYGIINKIQAPYYKTIKSNPERLATPSQLGYLKRLTGKNYAGITSADAHDMITQLLKKGAAVSRIDKYQGTNIGEWNIGVPIFPNELKMFARPAIRTEMQHEQYWNMSLPGDKMYQKHGLEPLKKLVGFFRQHNKELNYEDIHYYIRTKIEPFQYGGKSGMIFAVHGLLRGMAGLDHAEIAKRFTGAMVIVPPDSPIPSHNPEDNVMAVWNRMNDSERFGMKFGMFPSWVQDYKLTHDELVKLMYMPKSETVKPNPRIYKGDIFKWEGEKWIVIDINERKDTIDVISVSDHLKSDYRKMIRMSIKEFSKIIFGYGYKRNPGRNPALGLWAIVGGLALVGYGIYDNYKK